MNEFIESLDHEDNLCRLVMMDCKVPILKGIEYVAASGDVYMVTGGIAPHRLGSTGKIWTDQGDRYPSVIFARWATIKECEEASDGEFIMRDYMVMLSKAYEHLKTYNHTPHSAALVYFAFLAATQYLDDIDIPDLINHAISGEPIIPQICSLSDCSQWLNHEGLSAKEMYEATMEFFAEHG